MSKSPIAYQAYQQLAAAYSAIAPVKPHNAFYDRPAVQSLTPDPQGLQVLDAGCGPGIYAEWLLGRGAKVTGLDISEEMLAQARSRLGDRASLQKANLEEPMPFFADTSFDGILSALAINYVENLHPLFAEFYRILKPGAWLVFSTEHPMFTYPYFRLDNYFETQRVSVVWKGFGFPIEMHSYHHSLSALTDALLDNGFLLEKVLEPRPSPEMKAADPRHYEELMNAPAFIAFRARK